MTTKQLVTLVNLPLSIGTAFYIIWVHQMAYNWLIPPTFHVAPITFFQAFLIGFILAVFCCPSHLLALYETRIEKEMDEDEKAAFPILKTITAFFAASIELGLAAIISHFV